MRTSSSSFILAATIFASVSARPAAVAWDLSPSSSSDLSERGLVKDILGSFGAHSSSSASVSGKISCPSTFACNGKGTDGYELDVEGNGVPGAFLTFAAAKRAVTRFPRSGVP